MLALLQAPAPGGHPSESRQHKTSRLAEELPASRGFAWPVDRPDWQGQAEPVGTLCGTEWGAGPCLRSEMTLASGGRRSSDMSDGPCRWGAGLSSAVAGTPDRRRAKTRSP